MTTSAPTRRRAILLIICVVAGGVLSQAVATVIASTALVGTDFNVLPRALSGDEAARWWEAHGADPATGLSPDYSQLVQAAGSRRWLAEAYRGDDTVLFIRFEAGWPALSVTGALQVDTATRQRVWTSAWQLSQRFFGIEAGRAIPYGIIWSGLALNSLFYAALLWLLIRGPVELRRRLRQWRGRCTRCGYDLNASPGSCPECGDA